MAQAERAFTCYTGDGEVLRRKECPAMSDVCFKKIPGRKPHQDLKKIEIGANFFSFAAYDYKGETQRGCLITAISALITKSNEMGCHAIEDIGGEGAKMCLCDTELCNSSHGLCSNLATLLLTILCSTTYLLLF